MAKTINLSDGEATFTRAQLRRKIGVMLGRRQNGDSPLHLTTLNSAYAHFTGEFYVSPKHVGTERSPGPGRVRWAVVIQADNRGYDLSSYIPSPEELGDGANYGDRPLRLDELETLARSIKETDDHRGWLE